MIKKKTKYVLMLIILLLSMYMLTGCDLFNENSKDNDEKRKIEAYEEPINNVVNGLKNADSETFLKAFPDFVSIHVKDIYTDEYLGIYAKKMKEEYGTNVEMTYNIIEKSEILDGNLQKIEKEMKDVYEQDIIIKNGYKLKTEINIKGKNGEDTKNEMFEVYEIDGKWFILDL